MAGPQAHRPITHTEDASASRALCLQQFHYSQQQQYQQQEQQQHQQHQNSQQSETQFYQRQPQQQQQQQQQELNQDSPQEHVEIIVDENRANNDVERDTKRVRHKHRPLYRRLFNYIRTAWTGVNFSSGNDSELEELETPPRYRPDSLSALCRATRFSEAEIKRIYRGFKAECPTGVVKEDTFKVIYSQFFPQGGSCANSGQYAHYVFNTLDQDHSGIVSFELFTDKHNELFVDEYMGSHLREIQEFVQGLSILSRGSLEEKLRWTFSLYDINGDGFITREEMTEIVTAIYDLCGHLPDASCSEEDKIKEKVERIFQKMDVNCDGVVTLDEFLDCCHKDEAISRSMAVFDTEF